MDKLAQAFVPPSRIDLARETDFRLGSLWIRPSRREVEADGVRRVLQRRVMQVLVALAHSTNEVVSQRELTLRCWDGLSVSDDAIGRCIGQLRRLATSWSDPPFEIETIAGVGYRLEPAPLGTAWTVRTRPAKTRLPVRPLHLAAAIAGIAIVAAAAAWTAQRWLNRPPPLATPVVEVRPLSVIGDDPALRPFAARAADSIAGFLGDSDVRVVAGPPSGPGAPTGAQLAFSGAVSSASGQLRLRLFLEDTRSGTTLWSRDFNEPAARADALIDEAKGGAMETMNLIRPTYGPSGLTEDSDTLLLGIRGGEDLVVPTFANANDAVLQFEQALARRPDSGVLRSAYAAALATAGLGAPPADSAELLRRAQAEAERAIREHHDEAGSAYNTLLVVQQAEAPRDWVGAEARLEATLKAAPEDPFIYGNKCGFLLAVGRANDSLYYCQRALSLRPHTAPFLVNYATALDMQGDHPQLADQLLAEGARLYPDFLTVRVYRFARESFAGSPDKALALIHDPDTAPPIAPEAMRATELLEKARKTGSTADADAAMAAMRSAGAYEPIDDFRFLFPMALGRMDVAYAAPDIVQAVQPEEQLLVFHFTERLRRDARYWPLAARAGLVRYWLTTDKWPDFCSDPTYPLNCRAEAKRVASIKP